MDAWYRTQMCGTPEKWGKDVCNKGHWNNGMFI